MIKVVTVSEPVNGARHVRLSVTGHASGMNGCGNMDEVRVCAAVSAFVVSLLKRVEQYHPHAEIQRGLRSAGSDGEYDYGGMVSVLVPPEFFVELEFVIRAIQDLCRGYVGHIEMCLEAGDEPTEPGAAAA